MRKFLVTPAHGRVYKPVDSHTRVLVALPGDEIDIELARECGLLDEKPAEAPTAPPEAPEPAEPAKDTKNYQHYPMKPSRRK